MGLDPEDKMKVERIAQSLEGIEMLLAMWIEKAAPAAEIWIGEGPDRTLLQKPWRAKE